MNTITVADTQYEFQDIPGKGKCLVPVKDLKPINVIDELVSHIKKNSEVIYDIPDLFTIEESSGVYKLMLIKDIKDKRYNVLITEGNCRGELRNRVNWVTIDELKNEFTLRNITVTRKSK